MALGESFSAPGYQQRPRFFYSNTNTMPFQYITEAWSHLTNAGYHLQRGERDEVIITAPGGFVSRVRAKRLPSLARYVR